MSKRKFQKVADNQSIQAANKKKRLPVVPGPEGESVSYYAYLAQIEDGDNEDTYDITLELVGEEQVQFTRSFANRSASWLFEVPMGILELKSVGAQVEIPSWENSEEAVTVDKLFINYTTAIPSFWYLIRLSTGSGGISGSLCKPDDESPITCTIQACSNVLKDLTSGSTLTDTLEDQPLSASDLNALFHLPLPFAEIEAVNKPSSDIALVEGPSPTKQVGGIGVIDVGAGSCNVIFDTDGNPVCCFDIGKGSYAPDGLPAVNQNLSQFPEDLTHVILSHWDIDHWALAASGRGSKTKCDSQLKRLTWLVPDSSTDKKLQPTLSARTFLKSIPIANVKTITTKHNLGSTSVAGLSLEACSLLVASYTGTKARSPFLNNHGTLALEVSKIPFPSEKYFDLLCPGDASFENIENVVSKEYTQMLASHHGSDKYNASCPTPSGHEGAGDLVYSYGVSAAGKHAHRHPTQTAISNYKKGGWTAQYSTAEWNNIHAGNTSGTKPGPTNRGNIFIGASESKPNGTLLLNYKHAITENGATT